MRWTLAFADEGKEERAGLRLLYLLKPAAISKLLNSL
jgi:hypothetical protein